MTASKDLGGTAIQGLLWGIGGKGGIILSNLVVLVILSRLLGPVQFGIYATAYIFLDLSFALASSGIGIALVQRKDLSEAELNACFTGYLLVGLCLAILLLLLSGMLESALDMPGLKWVLMAVAVIIPGKLLAGFYGACLQREMKLRAYQNVQSFPQILCGLGITVPAALYGLGVWSLVIGMFASTLIECLVSGLCTSTRPRLTLSLAPLRPLLSVSAATLSNRMIVFLGENVDKMAIASLLGGASLGLYNRATSLVFLPTKLLGLPIENVLLSTFSKLQDRKAEIARVLERIVQMQSVLLIPIGIGLSLGSPLLIRVILGAQWESATAVAQILFAVTFARLGYIPSETAAIAIGKAWGATVRQLLFATTMIVTAVIGASFALIWVAVGVAVARLFFYLLSLRFVAREFGMRGSAMLIGHAQGFALAALSAIPAMGIAHFAVIDSALIRQMIMPGTYGSILLLLLLIGPERLIGAPLAQARTRLLAQPALLALRRG
jgi:PST family polysaccharide transporter